MFLSPYVNTFWKLEVAIIVTVFNALSVCDLIFNPDYLIFTWYEPNGSHSLNPLGLKVFGSQTIMMKIAWKRQNSIGNFPAKNSGNPELPPWPWVSPWRSKYHQLFSSNYWCQTGFIKWIIMTKGTWNYDTLISSYCVSHSVTTE